MIVADTHRLHENVWICSVAKNIVQALVDEVDYMI